MKQISESEIKRLVKLGDKSFIRVFDCLYLRISSTNRATWNFRFQSRGKRMQMKIGVYGERNSKTLMDVSNAIKTAIDLKNKSLNGDNPKLDLRRKKFYEIETVEDLATLYLLNKKDKIRTVHILERLYFKEVHPFIGHMLLKKIHPFDIYEVIQQVLKSGRKSIANKTLHLCKNIFKLGVKNQIIEMNPAANYSTKEDAGGNSRPRDVVLSLE